MDQPNIYYTALKMLGILVILLGGLYACLRLMKRLLHAGLIGKPDQLIRLLNVRSIGIKKQIALIEVPGAVLVIGMAGDRMHLLDKIVDPDIRNQIAAGGGQRTVST
jgi:flagellar biogenesis protein FliO